MFILIVLVVSLISLTLYKKIHKHQIIFYFIASVIAILAFLGRGIPLTKPINIGIVGLAFFYLVMIVGVLPRKWKLTKALTVLRKEWSIVGFLLIVPHSLFNLFEIIFESRSVTWFGIVTFAIMVPLFITSFTIIRKKMKPKSWKFLQSFAYIAYGALFVHIILNAILLLNLISYIIAFTPYVLLKSVMLIKKLRKK